MNELQKLFKYQGNQMRVVIIEDTPNWVVKDVCNILEIGNPTDAVKRLDDDECTLVSIEGIPMPVNAVTETGLYSLILGSRKPEAKAFKRWITHEVLPAIRKTGQYIAQPADETLSIQTKAKNAEARLTNAKRKDAELLLMVAKQYGTILSKESCELLTINAVERLTGQGFLPRPKVDKLYTAGDIAAETGLSANMVGRIATKHNLKTDDNGITVLDKSASSVKQVASFKYNERGRQALLEAIEAVGV